MKFLFTFLCVLFSDKCGHYLIQIPPKQPNLYDLGATEFISVCGTLILKLLNIFCENLTISKFMNAHTTSNSFPFPFNKIPSHHTEKLIQFENFKNHFRFKFISATLLYLICTKSATVVQRTVYFVAEGIG